eukprot:SAG22_NODE_7418_length_742_cov_0.617418_1_plen_47_part_01
MDVDETAVPPQEGGTHQAGSQSPADGESSIPLYSGPGQSAAATTRYS